RQLQGGGTIWRLEHPVAEPAQLTHGNGTYRGIILDEQHHLTRAARARRERRRIGRAGGGIHRREVQADGGAATRRALHLHVSAGLLREAIHHAEPEPRSLPRRLGGEEWLEHARHVLGQDTCARVGHGDRGISSRFHVVLGAREVVVE